MPRRVILAIDQGTTNTKAIAVDRCGAVLARANRPVQVAFPEPGWVEQDPEALWRSVLEAVAACLAEAGDAAVEAVGVTNQRESVIAWERTTGRPVGPCVVWQCRRTAPVCAALRARDLGDLVQARSGLAIDPLFSASKARWLLEHTPDGVRRAVAGELCLGTVDSWLVWKLTGGRVHATDVSNASRTQLLNLADVAWDAELLEVFGIPMVALPDVRPSAGVFGETAGDGPLPPGIPVASAIGDSHAALFGHGAFEPGPVKATYGTGSSLMTVVPVAAPSKDGLSTTVAWGLPGRTSYAREGNITATGSAVEWVAGLIGVKTSDDVAALAASVPDCAGVFLVPAFAGLGAPHWDPDARGLLCGLSRGTTPAHVARAAIEAIAYQVRDVFDLMRTETAGTPPALLADGGAARNDQLMQFQADVLGCPVLRSRSTDLSALGAAQLAGLSVGLWTMDDLRERPRDVDHFEPRENSEIRDRSYAGWRAAVSRARSRAPDDVGAPRVRSSCHG
jgi:glycerol kinase